MKKYLYKIIEIIGLLIIPPTLLLTVLGLSLSITYFAYSKFLEGLGILFICEIIWFGGNYLVDFCLKLSKKLMPENERWD